MTPLPHEPPSIEELHELCLRLKTRVEWLEGSVRQILAEHTRDGVLRPTWHDVEVLKKEIADLNKQIAVKRRK